MRIGDLHLGYCTNIHAANGWAAVLDELRAHAPALRARVNPDQPFGIGLRLSGQESRELLEGDRLQQFRAFLDAEGLYVFTINGFPHGSFHGEPVKAEVHAPDWRTEERVDYTLRLAKILTVLLPPADEGSISTSPLSYAAWVDGEDPAAFTTFTDNLVRVAVELVALRASGGPLIHLDIEPEADGVLATTDDLIRYYQEWLLPIGTRTLPADVLLDHIRVCFDACHAAVAFEDPATSLDRLDAAGIKVGKVQLSSALKVPLAEGPADRAAAERALRGFADCTYLHQVTQRNQDGTLVHHPDLPQALDRIEDPRAEEWRVHFHVPIFVDRYAGLDSTQADLRRTLELVKARGLSSHLEIETYTWDVLPSELKADLGESIRREYGWVLDVLG